MGKIERVNIASVQELHNLVTSVGDILFFGALSIKDSTSSGTLINGQLVRRNNYAVVATGILPTGAQTSFLVSTAYADHEASGYIYIQLDSGKERCCYALDESNISQSVGHKQRVSGVHKVRARRRPRELHRAGASLCIGVDMARRVSIQRHNMERFDIQHRYYSNTVLHRTRLTNRTLLCEECAV